MNMKHFMIEPILETIIEEVHEPDHNSILHYVQIGTKILYFNEDDIMFLKKILTDLKQK